MTTNTNASVLASFGLSDTVSLADGSTLASLSAVRHVPKRRCVCRGIWQGKRVFVKLFFGDKARHYAQRDINGVQHFQQGGILTPEILLKSEITQPAGFAVVFEEVVAAENAEVLWLDASEREQLALAQLLMQTLAAHHQAGLLQTDLYLKNFLVDGEKIYSIDGDGVRRYSALTNGKALTNLSQLLSKFDVLMLEKSLPTLLEAYGRARAWVVYPNDADVQAKVNAARRKATNAYADKKVFRQCTDVTIHMTARVVIAVSSVFSSLPIPTGVTGIDGFLKHRSLIKDGNTCTVALAQLGSHQVVIKRYNIKGFWHGISRAFRKTRAATSWGNAHRLQLLGLETAKPIALIETRPFGLRGKAYFLSEYIDAHDMTDFFGQVTDKALRANAVKLTVQLFYRLYLLKISHGDMKASNLKVLPNGQPSLIDLDSMRQHCYRLPAEKAHTKDLKRFMQNWKDQPSLYNAFVKVFKVVYADHAPLQAAQILE